MFQLLTSASDASDAVLVNGPVYLRPPAARDHEAWSDLRTRSRDHLAAWENDWTAKDLAAAAYKRRLRAWERQRRQRAGAAFFVFREEDDALLGGATLSNIRFGAARSGLLGYWIGAPHARRGYGTLAVASLVAHAFDTLALHRVEAACQPENKGSQALLRKLGFQCEGLARDYLRINGEWRDHEIYAVLAQDWPGGE